MKGFCLLLMLAAVVAIAICGPPALDARQDDYLRLQSSIADTGPVTVVESPVIAPAASQVVRDPGSCCGQLDSVTCLRLNTILRAARPRNIFRQGVRLITFLPCC